MSDAPDEQVGTDAGEGASAASEGTDAGAAEGEADAAAEGGTDAAAQTDTDGPESADVETTDVEALREQVEQKYDFENFGPDQMAEMDAEEWDAAFDPDTWITGEELLDRVEADLKHQVLTRDVFARVERLADGRVVAYSDEGYALVEGDGSVEGFGTVMRDVKPTVALCSMDSYDVPEMPEGPILPEPAEVPEGGGELGNVVLQVIAGVQVVAGVVLLLSWLAFATGLLAPPSQTTGRALNLTLMVVVGLAFLVIGLGLFLVVANARLSDKFRAEEYRDRLRTVGVAEGERPDFLPIDDHEWAEEPPELGTELDRDDPGRPDAGDGADWAAGEATDEAAGEATDEDE